MFEDLFEMEETYNREAKPERRKTAGRWMGYDELSGSDNQKSGKQKRSRYDNEYDDEDDYKTYSRRDPKREARKNPRRKDKWVKEWDY